MVRVTTSPASRIEAWAEGPRAVAHAGDEESLPETLDRWLADLGYGAYEINAPANGACFYFAAALCVIGLDDKRPVYMRNAHMYHHANHIKDNVCCILQKYQQDIAGDPQKSNEFWSKYYTGPRKRPEDDQKAAAIFHEHMEATIYRHVRDGLELYQWASQVQIEALVRSTKAPFFIFDKTGEGVRHIQMYYLALSESSMSEDVKIETNTLKARNVLKALHDRDVRPLVMVLDHVRRHYTSIRLRDGGPCVVESGEVDEHIVEVLRAEGYDVFDQFTLDGVLHTLRASIVAVPDGGRSLYYALHGVTRAHCTKQIKCSKYNNLEANHFKALVYEILLDNEDLRVNRDIEALLAYLASGDVANETASRKFDEVEIFAAAHALGEPIFVVTISDNGRTLLDAYDFGYARMSGDDALRCYLRHRVVPFVLASDRRSDQFSVIRFDQEVYHEWSEPDRDGRTVVNRRNAVLRELGHDTFIPYQPHAVGTRGPIPKSVSSCRGQEFREHRTPEQRQKECERLKRYREKKKESQRKRQKT